MNHPTSISTSDESGSPAKQGSGAARPSALPVFRPPLFRSPRRKFLATAKPPSLLHYAIIFIILAVISGIFGFGLIGGAGALMAKTGCVFFFALFVSTLFSRRLD